MGFSAIISCNFLMSSLMLLQTFINADPKQMTCANGWGYGSTDGPAAWPSFCSECGGSRQSPIVIQPDQAILQQMNPVVFHNYDKDLSALPLLNTGHSDQVNIPSEHEIGIEIPANPGKIYKLAQVHFHWGASNKDSGSEHVVGNVSYPFEIHLVHKSANQFAVLAVFGELRCFSENTALATISKSLPGTINPAASTGLLKSIKAIDLLPKDTSLFYTYAGSLTTPPCTEAVDWVVFVQPVAVKPNTLRKLRNLLDGHDSTINENHRPPQPLKGRVVSYSKPNKPAQPKASVRTTVCDTFDHMQQSMKQAFKFRQGRV